EAIYLISELVRAGRQIIGFDLCEVAPGKNSEWGANVGARLLFKLCGYSLLSVARQR
ncbi:MAG: arginase family protein, partial [Deltaproteobacteria bacterium]|nr:arginase family protein [Deltaproteobacteria bacterium]